MTNAALRPSLAATINQTLLGMAPRLFESPPAAGRRITAGFSFIHRIGKTSGIDVWFPQALQRELDAVITGGKALGPEHFPAEWAAVRQFELLQESGNYKIYDMDVTKLTRTMTDLTRNMRAGGYRVTVATLGSYADPGQHDELEILDKRLQDRISKLIHMLYLDEQSEAINAACDQTLAEEKWDYRTALPHIGVTLGARDLFRPLRAKTHRRKETCVIPAAPQGVHVPGWLIDHGVTDARNALPFARVTSAPGRHQYVVVQGHYHFAAEDAGQDIIIDATIIAGKDGEPPVVNAAQRRHEHARLFFDVLGLLPQKHIVHDTAVGLQLPEAINENEWIYVSPGDETLGVFNNFLKDIFAPFDKISLSGLHERADAGKEIKASSHHMRSYGDRMTAESDAFYASLAKFTWA